MPRGEYKTMETCRSAAPSSNHETAVLFELQDVGLTNIQAEKMRGQFGRNELTPPPKTPWWKELFSCFQDPTIRILLAAALISLLITALERLIFKNTDAGYFDSFGIFLAVGLATLIAFFSQRRSGKAFELLNKVKDDIPIKTFRNGQIDNLPIAEIVVGDLVKIDAGDKIPADGVLLHSPGIRINQSMLTGESVPVKKEFYKGVKSIDEIRRSIKSDHPAFLARGTTVIDGTGLMLIAWVGDETQMGKIARKLGEQHYSEEETPLVQKLSRLAKQISVAGIIGALTIFGVMTLEDLIQTPLLASLSKEKNTVLPLIAVSVILGLAIERFLLKPFFAGMGMKIRNVPGKLGILIPLVLSLSAIGFGLWGMTQSPEQAAGGIALLKETFMAFVVAVTIIVVAVPEGLPMMVTMSLALNMRKMVKENCLVRRLVASETIGSATVICTDKTGTLTENLMKPGIFYLGGRTFSSEEISQISQTSVWKRLCLGIALNSRAMLRFTPASGTGQREVTGIGNITESALLAFLYRIGVDYRDLLKEWKPVFELGHNSQRKMSFAGGQIGQSRSLFVKGAPEKVLERCSTVLIDLKEVPLSEHIEEINSFLARASKQAYRILAFAEKTDQNGSLDLPGSEQEALEQSGFRLVGFIGLSDPIRPEAAPSIAMCQNAHIAVKMITGDSPQTARAVAEAAGIPTDEPGSVLTSSEFAEIPDDLLSEAAAKIHVLARATPFDKLRLVEALHRTGDVVAMTGDGINDAPALRAADVGISMGKNGTEVAKEASDIVLIDDNFKSIVTGVWWGRTLFQNIRRFVQFQLSVNAAALLCALLGPLFHVPLPLTVTQLLWINIIMDTFAAMALSTEPPRPQTLKERPIPRSASIITGTMGLTIITAGIYQTLILFLALFGGWFVDSSHCYNSSVSIADPEYLVVNKQSLTIFFTIFVMFQFWHTFNCRSLKFDESGFRLITQNPSFIFIITTIALVQIGMVQAPLIGKFFRTEPLNFRQWFSIILLTFSIIPIVKIVRFIALKFSEKKWSDVVPAEKQAG